jgi:hypothetical protein
MDNLVSCDYCYKDDYKIAFTIYKNKAFCGYCLQYHASNNIKKLYKKYIKLTKEVIQ